MAGPVSAQVQTQPPGWVLDWSDEFDGPVLDRTKWVPETGGNGWGNDFRGWNNNLRGYDAGNFTCTVDRGRTNVNYSGIRGL